MVKNELKDNPYIKRFRELIEQLTAQKGSLFASENQIKAVYEKIDDYFINNINDDIIGSLIYSMNLHISDRSIEAPKLYAVCGFGVAGKEVAENLRNIASELCGYVFLNAYEAHRQYLYDITKLFLFHHPEMVEAMVENEKNRKKWSGKARKASNEKDQEYWNEFVNNLHRKDVCEALLNANPDLKRWESNMYRSNNSRSRDDVEYWNNNCSDWDDWYEVATEARNAVTHSSFVVDNKKANRWNNKRKCIFANYFGKEANGEYKVILDQSMTDYLIRKFGEHAFLVFKAVSIKDDFIWDILKLNGNWD